MIHEDPNFMIHGIYKDIKHTVGGCEILHHQKDG
jgi:hypothetical protein